LITGGFWIVALFQRHCSACDIWCQFGRILGRGWLFFGAHADKFRRAVFGPLKDMELWVVNDLIALTGLVPMRDELCTHVRGHFEPSFNSRLPAL
jgi:hypothetical protein